MRVFLLMCLVSITLFAQYRAPMDVEGSTYVDSKAAYALYQKGAKFLDVRPPNSIARGKIKGAIEMYVGYMTPEKLANVIKKDQAVVVYCNGQYCSLTPEALIKMKKWGYLKLYYYRDGYPAWKYFNLPSE